jgi:parallel beta-helix repeat protein
MRKSHFVLLISLLCLVLISTFVSAKNCGGTINCSCGDTVTSDHNMTYDILDCPNDGLILERGTILDCKGHTIDGVNASSSKGIVISYAHMVDITNCNIQDFQFGIFLHNSEYSHVLWNTIHNNERGIYTKDLGGTRTSDAVIESNTITDNVWGIWWETKEAGSPNTIKSNIIKNNSYRGIARDGNSRTWIMDNWIEGNYQGLVYNTGSKDEIWGNTFLDNVLHNGYEGYINSNDWDYGKGNTWSDFRTNPGYPNEYHIPGYGGGGGIDHFPKLYPSNPPNKPNTPTGPNSGVTLKEYTFTASTTDPEDDDIFYMWDAEGNVSDWMGPYNSGESINVSYLWTVPDIYNIKVKAKDIYGYESDWSDVLLVNITETDTYFFDNSDPEFFTIYGKWKKLNYLNAHNKNLRYVQNGIGISLSAWRVDKVIFPGNYNVYVWKFEHQLQSKSATNAKYAIIDKDGTYGWFEVDQSTPGNEWIPIGNFSFNNDFTQGVFINDNADGVVIADAIKLVYIG